MADLKKKEVSRSRMAEFPAGTPLRSGDEFPTEDIICEALENKSFERLNNCLVIASSDEHDMRFINEETLNIYFRDDVWTNRYVRTHIGETLRTVNFSGIRDPELRLEAKIISASLLWIVGRTAKTQSLIRKCANIVAGAPAFLFFGGFPPVVFFHAFYFFPFSSGGSLKPRLYRFDSSNRQ